MFYQKSSYLPSKTAMNATFFCACLVMMQVFTVPAAKAVEVLSAQELSSHCALLISDPEGVDGQYCIRYVQGFIDGAVATDVRVMLNAENTADRKETYTERAMRTRVPSRAERSRAASLAGFCLGDPLPLRDVVDVVVADLTAISEKQALDVPAMDVVYASLRQHYPCKS
jgi:hypothetical protein